MEWNEVKAKPKRQGKPRHDDEEGHWGGKQHGHLVAGAVAAHGHGKTAVSHHAAAIADQDFLKDENEEIKFETVSHDCAAAVQAARLVKDLSQAELAKLVNEKPSAIHDLENGTAQYNADLINRIEKVLGVKIPRGRKNKRHSKKPQQF